MRIYNRDPHTGRIKKGHTPLLKEERDSKFWSCVAIIPFHECWEWVGPKTEKGYGRFHIGQHKYSSAHRYSLALAKDLDPTKVIDHKCRNRGCVNPAHLREVTSKVNSLENSLGAGAINKAKTHCKHGHPYDQANTGRNPNGTRYCKTCRKNRHRNEYTDRATAKAAAVQKVD